MGFLVLNGEALKKKNKTTEKWKTEIEECSQ